MVTFYVMSSDAARWLLLSYRLPREPTRLRLAVWRRLKRVGAVPLHGAVWTVPRDAKTREDFEWLAEEIEEAGGTVFVWEADSLDAEQNRRIAGRLMREAENRYAALAAGARSVSRAAAKVRDGNVGRLRSALRRARGLERELRLERRRDFLRAPGRGAAEAAVTEALEALRARLDKHAVGDATALSR
jgi:DNA-binding transcriptional regulator PaaX